MLRKKKTDALNLLAFYLYKLKKTLKKKQCYFPMNYICMHQYLLTHKDIYSFALYGQWLLSRRRAKSKVHWNRWREKFNLNLMRGYPRGVMVKAMNCRIVVREFVLQSRYYVHFLADTSGKDMNLLILPAMC